MNPGFLDIVTNETDEDGVTTERRLHLNNPDGVFHIKEWHPIPPPPQDIYQESPFSDGRMIAMRKYGNSVETIVLDAQSEDPAFVNLEIRELRYLITKAVDYWKEDYTVEPVWLELRGDGEESIRFAYLYAGDAPEESNPLEPPRASFPSLVPDFNTILEHGFWMDDLDGNCIELSASQDYYNVTDDDFSESAPQDSARVDRTAANISLGDFQSGKTAVPHTLGSGMRFRSVAVPQGATIVAAYIKFKALSSLAGATCNLILKGENSATPAQFSTYANYTGRALTTTTVDWDAVSAWVADSYYDSPDISSIVEEIVALGGWASGNNLVIFVEDNGSSNGAYREAYTFSDGESPVLYITWYSGETREYGISESTCEGVLFSDRHNRAQITDAFYYDASAGTYSAELIGSALPYALFPAVPAVGDILYLGSNIAIPDSGPFGSCVFDLSVVDAGMAGTWEYWNGAAWTSVGFEVYDFTNGFRNSGKNEVSWVQPDDWGSTLINLVTAFYVRFVVTAVNANRPTQQNQGIYAIVTPYVEINKDQVGGDVAMLAELEVYERVPNGAVYQCPSVICGLRKVKRGKDFTAYINMSDEQNPAGITIGPGAGAFGNDMTAATGRAINWNSGVANFWENCGEITFDNTISDQYYGTFMTYLRVSLDVYSWHYLFKYYVLFGGTVIFESPVVAPLSADTFGGHLITIVPFGEMGIPTDPARKLADMTIELYAQVDNVTYNARIQDFIMIPNDEWIGQYSSQHISGSIASDLQYPEYLSVNPISNPKLPEVATKRDSSNDKTLAFWDDKTPYFPKLHHIDTQRLWFLHYGAWSDQCFAFPSHTGMVKLTALKKFFETVDD